MTGTEDANVYPGVGSIGVISEQVVYKKGNTWVTAVKGKADPIIAGFLYKAYG